jgi:hypothetical protein
MWGRNKLVWSHSQRSFLRMSRKEPCIKKAHGQTVPMEAIASAICARGAGLRVPCRLNSLSNSDSSHLAR